MPKQEDKLLSESEYGDMSMEEAIRGSIRDIQQGLINVEKSLLDLIEMDVITMERFMPCYELSNELIVLSKELMEILKELKPSGFNKARKEMAKQQEDNIEAFKRSGLV